MCVGKGTDNTGDRVTAWFGNMGFKK